MQQPPPMHPMARAAGGWLLIDERDELYVQQSADYSTEHKYSDSTTHLPCFVSASLVQEHCFLDSMLETVKTDA